MSDETISFIRKCRVCGGGRLQPVFDMGLMPLANALRTDKAPNQRYPLTLLFCEECTLVQIRETIDPSVLFSDNYLYYSSQSETAVSSARALAEKMIKSHDLQVGDLVMEAASNDGYLLKHYLASGASVIGVDPAREAAKIAAEVGVHTDVEFFSARYAEKYRDMVDVFHANNVLAHVQNQNDFVRGIEMVLRPGGVAVIEVPYLGKMISHREFDTIYHEHLCYFSLTSLQRLFSQHGLSIRHVDMLSIHGGSLRVFVMKGKATQSQETRDLLRLEQRDGMHLWNYYADFGARANMLGSDLWRLFDRIHRNRPDARISGYGAAAKGNQLLSYFDIDFLNSVIDSTPAKQGKYMSGVNTLISSPSHEYFGEKWTEHTDFVLILAWNFKEEIMAKHPDFKGKWIVPIPDVQLVHEGI